MKTLLILMLAVLVGCDREVAEESEKANSHLVAAEPAPIVEGEASVLIGNASELVKEMEALALEIEELSKGLDPDPGSHRDWPARRRIQEAQLRMIRAEGELTRTLIGFEAQVRKLKKRAAQ